MRFSVRITAPLDALVRRMRASPQAGRRGEGDRGPTVGLPSTSSLRDPAEMAVLTRFDEPLRDGT
ncbi:MULTISPECIES: hypothetical protein [unclassified Aureimonas]|uniref:hypothetical protein n=1 Tax=unclassified Aureimonas TaxID=2615206 RepID=UPI0006FFB179|nr:MULTISPECIES: hypothetical protein [unclassified Aureimonas]KQT55268.1 hypothetical protein ASG62_10580 [Aureimonas sp. Leaf427]KQT71059.1 hypothetical protein ASG54_20965 [Aureimonas sp. Leaf460]